MNIATHAAFARTGVPFADRLDIIRREMERGLSDAMRLRDDGSAYQWQYLIDVFTDAASDLRAECEAADSGVMFEASI
jgi:hypothetical protein